MTISKRILAAAAFALAVAPSPVLAQGKIYSFTPDFRNGVCSVTFPGGTLPGSDKPFKFQFSYRVRDGNFGASIQVNGWDKAQELEASEDVRPMTLRFDTGKTSVSRSGGYSSGFNDQAWGGWGPGAGSDAAMAMLAEAKAVAVGFDGREFGTIDLHLKGLAHVSLTDCAKQAQAEAG